MGEYVDRYALNDELAKLVPYAIADSVSAAYTEGLNDAHNVLLDFPAADVAPALHAKWYVAEWNKDDANFANSFYCDNCHCVEPFTMRFCPNCGAKMENGKDYRSRTLKDIASNYPPDGPVNCGARMDLEESE